MIVLYNKLSAVTSAAIFLEVPPSLSECASTAAPVMSSVLVEYTSLNIRRLTWQIGITHEKLPQVSPRT